MTRRTERIGHLIQRELGDLILRELADSRIGFVTISRVDVTTDLALAKVYVSVFGDEKSKKSSLAALNHSASYLRTLCAKAFTMRTMPKLEFILDKNLEHGFRINEILKDLQHGEGGKASNPDDGPEDGSDPESVIGRDTDSDQKD